jgi:hypothetical protein
MMVEGFRLITSRVIRRSDWPRRCRRWTDRDSRWSRCRPIEALEEMVAAYQMVRVSSDE